MIYNKIYKNEQYKKDTRATTRNSRAKQEGPEERTPDSLPLIHNATAAQL